MENELKSLQTINVWREVPSKQANQVLGTRWVYEKIGDPTGNIIRQKSWVVVQGYCQTQGLNFDETFAPTLIFTGMRFLFSIRSENDWDIQNFHVTKEYLHSMIEEDIFLNPQPGTEIKINKAFYGLKQPGWC
ncbi:hypothetical protein O181_113075 [Austropuccinia psidii MF-1]|uniref:Reverse transcriptase Ty1/copia-type domain-containing protein n=1 Tax=Austropuccinia psidii MF-1 TaxID=1389203 RepID=A0A9Q3K1R9_9BASI|nr:hypothetical protein [Austropuccinia psidii MF-1]